MNHLVYVCKSSVRYKQTQTIIFIIIHFIFYSIVYGMYWLQELAFVFIHNSIPISPQIIIYIEHLSRRIYKVCNHHVMANARLSFRCSKIYTVRGEVGSRPVNFWPTSPGPFPLLCTAIRLYRSPSNVLIIHIGDVINRVRLLLNRLLRCPENGRRPFATDSSLTHTGRANSITSSLTVSRPTPSPQPS